MDDGLLSLRVVVGVALIRHGTQKLFGWSGGPAVRERACSSSCSRTDPVRASRSSLA